MKRRAQVTIFIIIAVVIIAAVVGYFLIRDRLTLASMPATFQPVEQYFISCINQQLDQGKKAMAYNGGWIYPPVFEPGSEYAPFSSQLDFTGAGIPYWYYLSENNIVKEQAPSKTQMQNQLAQYLKENLNCDFSDYQKQGYVIILEMNDVSVTINDLDIQASVSANLNMQKENDSYVQRTHDAKINTKFGKMYSEAMQVYNSEKQQAFLENYAVDFLRLYAPVDGVEMSCAPKIWVADNVISDLKSSLQSNIQEIKTIGNANDYFKIKGLDTTDKVNFMYSPDWPSRFEVWPAEGSVMTANPIGNQQGLGILGFCYVSYHFVYDMMFPVVVQVYDNNELFQFPFAVVIQKNMPRVADNNSQAVQETSQICNVRDAPILVYTGNANSDPVEANINFQCFDTSCSIGKTSVVNGQAKLMADFPRCVNGILSASAPGYNEKKIVVSSNEQSEVDVILDKFYDTPISINVGGKEVSRGVVYFSNSEYSTAVSWPEQKSVKLIEGAYNVTLYVYTNSSLVFPSSNQQKCVQVSATGIAGLFGQTKEQCFDINIPEQQLTSVLIGGGKIQDYFTKDRLENGLEISGQSLPMPKSLEDIQKNYDSFETKSITIG